MSDTQTQTIPSHNLLVGAWVPGMPHLLKESKSYAQLAKAMESIGHQWAQAGVKQILFFSTQWRSVLGHMFLAGPDAAGIHVDDNWYDLGDISYQLNFDPKLVEDCAHAAEIRGFQTKVIRYPGFPIDTGTLVAHNLILKGARQHHPDHSFKVGAVSCSIYSDYLDTFELACSLQAVLKDQGTPTGVVVVSLLSGRTLSDDFGEVPEQIASQADEIFNQECLQAIDHADIDHLKSLVETKGGASCADMGLRGLAFLEGLGLWTATQGGQLMAYGPIHGTGGAVISFG